MALAVIVVGGVAAALLGIYRVAAAAVSVTSPPRSDDTSCSERSRSVRA
jgi:hypothetical protein